MSPRAGFFRETSAESNARQVDPATWDPGLPVPIPHVQASSSSRAPTLTTPPQDGSPFPLTATSTPIPKPPLLDPAVRMTLAVRSTPSSSALVRRASASDPSSGAIVAIVAGVTLFFVLVAVLLHIHEVKSFYTSIVTRIRRRGLATPAKEVRQWDVLSPWNEASALASTAASSPEPYTAHTARMRDVSIHLVSTAEHAPLPPLRPNRRPPSGVVDPPSAHPSEPTPPLSRLEPLRRKSSKSGLPAPLALAAREPTPPATPPKDAPPLPPPSPSSTSASASASASASTSTPERRVEPSAPAKLTIQMPKPVRGDLRPISAYTSASTTLSEMPLLKPSMRAHEGQDTRLSKVLAVTNPEAHSPGGAFLFLPPIPPVPPIPPIYLPKLAPEKEREREREASRPLPAKPFDALCGPPPEGGKPVPTRTTSQGTAQTPTSAAASDASASSSSPALRRTNSCSSTRSPRSPVRKPVPPLTIPSSSARSRSPSDGESSIWAMDSGWRKNSLASTALDSLAGSRWGSPVPSSSASQMYRTRDSGLSEWTWTRPLEEWEKEQMNLRRKASAGDLSPPSHAQRGMSMGMGMGMGMGGVSTGGGGGAGEGRWGHKASASMGEMRVVRGIVPDVPKVPRQYRP